MKKTWLYYSLLGWLLVASHGFASSATYNTYRVTLPATASPHTAIIQDVQQAFTKLLKQLTGQTITELPSSSQLMSFVDQYQYNQHGPNPEFIADFDKQAITNYLKDKALLLLSTTSAGYLLWVVIEEKTAAPQILGTENAPLWLKSLVAENQQKGLTLVLPELDMEDLNNISVEKIRHHEHPALQRASQRYQVDGYMTAWLTPKDQSHWLSKWYIHSTQYQLNFQLQGSLEQTLKSAQQQLLTQITALKTIPTPRTLYIQANDITSNNQQALLYDNLRRIQGVTDVQLDGVTPESVLYKLTINIEKERFVNSLYKNKVLTLQPESSSGDLLHVRLHA